MLEPALGDAVGHGVAVAISVAIAYLLTTSAHVIVGEQAPKIYAITHAESTVAPHARGRWSASARLDPVIWALNGASNAILRVVGSTPSAEFDEAATAEDLKLLIAQSAHGGRSTRARRACSRASSICTSSRRAR